MASTVSVALPDTQSTLIVGQPVLPGPRILEAPASSIAVVAVPVPEAPKDPGDALLMALVGDWIRPGEVCPDPLYHWLITPEAITVGGDICAIADTGSAAPATVIEAICSENGVTYGRDFIFEPVDLVTMSFVTGEQSGLLTRSAPG